MGNEPGGDLVGLLPNNVSNSLLKCQLCNVVGIIMHGRQTGNVSHNVKCLQCDKFWMVCIPCQMTLNTKKIWKVHLSSKRHKAKHAEVDSSAHLGQEAILAQPMEEHLHDHLPFFPREETATQRLPSEPETLGNNNDAAVKNEPKDEQDWMVTLEGPRSTHQVTKEALIGVFGVDSASPPFYHYESGNPGKGAHFLVASAYGLAQPNLITEQEVKFCLNMTGLLSRLTEQEQKQLSHILFDAANANNKDKTIFKNILLPTSTADFNRIFVNGKKSILENIPRPVVRTTGDGTHAYVCLIDVIANMMAANVPIDRFDRTTSMYDDLPDLTPRHHNHTTSDDDDLPDLEPRDHKPRLNFGAKLVTTTKMNGVSSTHAAYILLVELEKDSLNDEYTGYLYCKEWSDDFDPSHSKDNRNQVWMKTYTICPPTDSAKPDRGQHTAVISLGAKCDDHEEVESLITVQLKKLSTGEGISVYHGGLNRLIKIKAGVLSTCVDRPERTKMYSVGDHNGSYSVCWGYAAHVDPMRELNCLPSCPFCRNRRVYDYQENGAARLTLEPPVGEGLGETNVRDGMCSNISAKKKEVC